MTSRMVMILDSLPDFDTSGLCLVKTLSTALTASEHPRRLRRAPKGGRPRYTARAAEDNRSTLIADIPFPALETSQPSGARAKTGVLRACRVPNPAKRLNVVQRPKTLFEPQRSMTSRS